MNLLFAAFSTIAVETLFWSFFRRYRRWHFLSWCVLVNLWSNLTLNIILWLLWKRGDTLLSWKVIIGEILVLFSEFGIFCIIENEQRKKLFLLTLAANAITFSLSFIR